MPVSLAHKERVLRHLEGTVSIPCDPDEDLCTAPGAADLTFGSLLDAMLRNMFRRFDSLSNDKLRRHYLECTVCKGTDQDRLVGQRPAIDMVRHTDSCLLHKHMPRLRAMANKDVT